tara:strand:+ start:3212 stop:3409 length:198 start_codon:yes stop_codon:yes gene_type:complete
MEVTGMKLLKATTNVSKLASDLGVSRMAVYQWKEVPANRLVEIEQLTGIPRQDLRPDLYRGMKNE